jgi:membrane-associated phospholipid phosphatase
MVYGCNYIFCTVADLVIDAVALNVGLIDWDSLKIISSIFPFFVASRMIDSRLQNCFYQRCNHRNVNQLPRWCHEAIRYGIGLPIGFLGLQGLLARDPNLHETGRIFLIGMPFVIFGKELIKKIRCDACLRPWNQYFSRTARAFGGFPSGHMAEASYMALLYGLRFGPVYGIPLTILSVLLGIIFLNCNRHYLSQLVAGVGLGAVYAVSAYKLIDKRLDNLSINVCMDSQGYPCLNIGCDF